MLGFLLLAAQIVAAPSPQPTPVPTATPAPEYQVGVATIADVTAKLGKPNSVTSMSDGTKILVYYSSHTRVKGASFVPVVGLFAGGAKSRMSFKIFTFGPDGLLKSLTSSESQADCNVGIGGGGCH